MMDTLAAICSAIAAVASAVAAFLSFTLAKRTAAQTLEAERRNLEHDIEEIARTVQVESQRATRVYQQIKPIQDSLSAIVGRFGGIGHSEAVDATAHTNARIAAIQQQTEKLATAPSDPKLSAADLAARLPSLHVHLVAIRGILDDGLVERDRLTAEIASHVAERNERDRERRAARGSAPTP
jgi:chromosome segregation ATPase